MPNTWGGASTPSEQQNDDGREPSVLTGTPLGRRNMNVNGYECTLMKYSSRFHFQSPLTWPSSLSNSPPQTKTFKGKFLFRCLCLTNLWPLYGNHERKQKRKRKEKKHIKQFLQPNKYLPISHAIVFYSNRFFALKTSKVAMYLYTHATYCHLLCKASLFTY